MTTKKCKGTNKAKDFKGCGKPSSKRQYGLCVQCLRIWATTTQEGGGWLKKQTAYKYKKNQAEKKREERKKDRKMKIDLMSTSEYWSKVFQPRINKLIRIIDNGCGCIATGRTTGQIHAGHFVHSSVNKTISINMHNLHSQSAESNVYRSGDILNYREGIKRVYGQEYLEFMESLNQCPALNLTKIELMEANQRLSKLIKEFKASGYFNISPVKRIELRNKANEVLGLYPKEYATYKQD